MKSGSKVNLSKTKNVIVKMLLCCFRLSMTPTDYYNLLYYIFLLLKIRVCHLDVANADLCLSVRRPCAGFSDSSTPANESTAAAVRLSAQIVPSPVCG